MKLTFASVDAPVASVFQFGHHGRRTTERHVMRKYRFQLTFSAGCGIAAVLLTWLLGSESLADSSLRVSSALSNFVGFANIVPYFLSAVLSGNDFGEARGELAYWALVFAQWAALGLVISAFVCRCQTHDVNA